MRVAVSMPMAAAFWVMSSAMLVGPTYSLGCTLAVSISFWSFRLLPDPLTSSGRVWGTMSYMDPRRQ